MSKAIIVTGAYGYIGSVVCKYFKERGYNVIGIDYDHRKKTYFDTKGYADKYYCIDVRSTEFSELLQNLTPKYSVIHLAADSLLGDGAFRTAEYYDNNINGVLRIAEHVNKGTKVLFASSASVYDRENFKYFVHKPFDVKKVFTYTPSTVYGQTKLWGEYILNNVSKLREFSVASLRFFNVVGGYGDVGQTYTYPHIFPAILRAVVESKPFVLNGNKFPTKDGTCVRDYVHVLDVCSLIESLLTYMESNTNLNLTINVGSGIGHSVLDVLAVAEKLLHRKIEYVVGKPRHNEPPYLVANIRRTRKYGFHLENSMSLEYMLKTQIDYFKAEGIM